MSEQNEREDDEGGHYIGDRHPCGLTGTTGQPCAMPVTRWFRRASIMLNALMNWYFLMFLQPMKPAELHLS